MGTRSNRLAEAVLTSTHNLCFDQKYVKYRIFLSENFHFLVVKFSVYLNRRVFVMRTNYKRRAIKCHLTRFLNAANRMQNSDDDVHFHRLQWRNEKFCKR